METNSRAGGPVRALHRVLAGVLGAVGGTVLGLALAVPVDLALGLFAAEDIPRAIAAYAAMITPVALVAGALAGALAAYSRWSQGTGSAGVAILAGVVASAVGAVCTFGLLWAPLEPWVQVAWIILIGLGAGLAMWRLERRQASD